MWVRILVWVSLVMHVSFAKLSENDSLRQILQNRTQDTSTVHLLIDIAWKSRFSDPEQLRVHGQRALDLSHKLGYDRGIVLGLKILGAGQATIGNDKDALAFYQEAILMAESIDLSNEIAILHNAIGVSFNNLGNYDKALEYYLKAAAELEDLQDSFTLAKVYSNMGELYTDNKQWELALGYFFKSLEAKKRLNNRRGMAVTYYNIGRNYQLSNQLDSALLYFGRGLDISRQLKDVNNQSRFINNVGEVYQLKGDLNQALIHYRKALILKEQIDDRKSQVTTLNNLGRTYLDLGRYDLAIGYLERGVGIAGETESKPEIRDGYELLARTYQSKDDYRKAFYFQVKADSVKGEILDEERNRILIEVQTKYELENKEREIEALNNENTLFQSNLSKQRVILILTISGLLLLAVLVFLFYRVNLNNQKTNRILSQQKEEIEAINRNLLELNDEKNSLIGIVAHDLRTPLNQVVGLIDLIKLRSDNLTSQQKDWLERLRTSTDGMSQMISRILDVEAIESKQVSFEPKRINLVPYFNKAVEEFGPESREKNIIINYSLPREAWVLADEDYLLQVFSNLISNAIKFSPPDSKVTCNLEEDDESYQMEIKDRGPGVLSEEIGLLFRKFQTLSAKPTAHEQSTGLGLYIVKKYLDAMEGEVWCRSTPTEGSSFFVKLKKATA